MTGMAQGGPVLNFAWLRLTSMVRRSPSQLAFIAGGDERERQAKSGKRPVLPGALCGLLFSAMKTIEGEREEDDSFGCLCFCKQGKTGGRNVSFSYISASKAGEGMVGFSYISANRREKCRLQLVISPDKSSSLGAKENTGVEQQRHLCH